MVSVEIDDTAADVAWDLGPLVQGRGPQGVDEALDEADRRADELAKRHGRVADLDAAGLAAFMDELAQLQELLGRAGAYASLRFAVDTSAPENGALLQRVQERSTAVGTKLIFFELEWAAFSDERAAELLADPVLAP